MPSVSSWAIYGRIRTSSAGQADQGKPIQGGQQKCSIIVENNAACMKLSLCVVKTLAYGCRVGRGCHDVHICDLWTCTHTRFADVHTCTSAICDVHIRDSRARPTTAFGRVVDLCTTVMQYCCEYHYVIYTRVIMSRGHLYMYGPQAILPEHASAVFLLRTWVGTWINHVTTVKNCLPKIVP